MTLTTASLDPQYLQVPSNYQYGFLTDAELFKFAQDESNQMDEAFIKNAVDKGDKCYGIIENNRLVSYGWYSSKETLINDDLMLHFDGAWIYMYKGYTQHSHRGQRLHAVGMAMALKAFSEMGKKGIISYVETVNYRSLKSTARMGYQNFGKVFIWEVFNRFWIKTEEACLPYGFTVKENVRPVQMVSSQDSAVRRRHLHSK